MGEAKKKRQQLSTLVQSEPRCIYCSQAPASIEHMPPIAMFKKRSRPIGMEFAACKSCNEGTRAADLVASFFCRLSRAGEASVIQEAVARRGALRQLAPGVLEELLRPEKESRIWLTERGVAKPFVHVKADGELTAKYLTVFTAKFGMALYREYTGTALPTGAEFTLSSS